MCSLVLTFHKHIHILLVSVNYNPQVYDHGYEYNTTNDRWDDDGFVVYVLLRRVCNKLQRNEGALISLKIMQSQSTTVNLQISFRVDRIYTRTLIETSTHCGSSDQVTSSTSMSHSMYSFKLITISHRKCKSDS